VHVVVPGRTVSVNGTYRGGRGIFKSREAVDFQGRIAYRTRAAMVAAGYRAPTGEAVGVEVVLYLAHPLMDLDGPTKLILDALAGPKGAYLNDRQVELLVLRKKFDTVKPRLLIDVFTLNEDHGEA
jgi:Holliday junction resolvase RusA-like endonuclease